MFLLSKSKSRIVHHYGDERERQKKLGEGGDDEAAVAAASTSLTVWRKSLVFSCSGFTVIGSDGGLAYRVDNYTGRPLQITLMDGSGTPIFTLCRRRKLRVLEYWVVYEGEVGEYCSSSSSSKNKMKSSKKKVVPIFSVRKNMTKVDVLANVYNCEKKERCKYVIEGSFRHRCCKILDDSRRVVGEIKKKEAVAASGASFGLEVFHLIVKPDTDFNSRFAMAIVLLLDQMYS